MNRWISVMGIGAFAGTCSAVSVASYNPGLGTLPQAQGWTFAGNASPGLSVAGGILQYGPTTQAGTTYWNAAPPNGAVDFSTTTWSITVDVRLTNTTYGNVSGFRRGGF